MGEPVEVEVGTKPVEVKLELFLTEAQKSEISDLGVFEDDIALSVHETFHCMVKATYHIGL